MGCCRTDDKDMYVAETLSLTNGRITPPPCDSSPSFVLAPPSRSPILAPPSSQTAPRVAASPPSLRILLRSSPLLLHVILLHQGVLLLLLVGAKVPGDPQLLCSDWGAALPLGRRRGAVTVHTTVILAHLTDLLPTLDLASHVQPQGWLCIYFKSTTHSSFNVLTSRCLRWRGLNFSHMCCHSQT